MRLGRVMVSAGVGAVLLAWCGVARVQAEDRTALSSSRAAAQAAQAVNAPTIQVYSRETVVDVTVLDKNNKPVHGLTQADFTIQEDKRPEAIRSFAEFGSAAPAAVQQTTEQLPPHVYSNRRPPANGAVNIIVLDAVNTGMLSQMRSRMEAEKYLRKMPPGTQVALLQLGNELKFVQGFTSDPEVLIATMTDMKDTVMTPGAMSGSPCMANIISTRVTLEALRQISAMVMGIKGKKNVLWFTGPRELNIGPGCPYDTPGLDETLDMLTAAEVTVTTINPNVPCMPPPGVTCVYGGMMLDQNIVPATGGEHYGGNDMIGNLARVIETGSNYYTLTYVPAHGNDKNYHYITVKVNRPGLTLMYRPGYGADDLAKAKAESRIPTTLDATTPDLDKNTMKASMARFAPPATQLLFDVKLAPTETAPGPTDPAVMGFPVAEVKGKPMQRYDVLYTLPADQISFTDGADGVYRGSVEFDVVASDVYGKLITSVSRTIQLPLTMDEYADFVKTPFKFFQQIDLPAGQAYVRVGILDGVSKKVGTVEVPVKIDKGAAVVRAGK